MHVIGTAGHVDHGKTTLLRALTGMEPSRLAEERARGMTMQLGFVWMPGPDGRPIGIIDVPGHADYRLHALSGASAFDAFLFICACDDGWMPQSEEHLWALAAFGVDRGVVVLTKADLVSDARVRELKAELEVRFFEALGREVPVVIARDAINQKLFSELATLPAVKDLGRPQMHVDRVFTVTGQGTVVTGTLRDGTLAEKQVVEVLPAGKKTQIRAIQCYGKRLGTAAPTSRVALQLANLGVADVPKDSQIVVPGTVHLTAAVDVRVRLFQDYRVDPRKTPEVIVVHGGVRTKAKMIPIAPVAGTREATWHLRLKLGVTRAARFDDRCLVLSSGADKVLGAGRIVDEAPSTSVTAAAALLAEVRDFTAAEHVALNRAKSGAFRADDMARRTRFTPPVAGEGLQDLGDWLVDPARADGWKAAILAQISRHHAQRPAEDGLPESALVKAQRLDPTLVRALVKDLKAKAALTQVGPHLKLPAHVPRADQTSALAARLEDVATRTTPAVHSLFELGVDDDDARRVLARFLADGKLVRMDEKHVMGGLVYADLTAKVAALMTAQGPVTAGEVRDALQVGRKVVIMLLEAMDQAKLTQRSGDRRGPAGAR